MNQFDNYSLFPFRFEKETFTEWAEGVDEIAKTNLEKPLLVRERKDAHDLIRVNFDPQVSNSSETAVQHILYQ